VTDFTTTFPAAPYSEWRHMKKIALSLCVLFVLDIHAATKRRSVSRGSGDSPFGVVLTPDVNSADAADAMNQAQKAGIGWVTVEFTWSKLQPSPGTANFAPFSALVDAATSNKLKVLGRLGFSTNWNTTAPSTVTDPTQREHYPPANVDDFGRYVFTVVQTYKANVHAWEIWYEPDVGTPTGTCTGYWCGTPAQYARLLAVAYRNVKAADPNATVLLGGLALSGDQQNPNFLTDILNDAANPAGASIDVAAVHAYGSEGTILLRMNQLKSQLAFGGASGVQIWVTEFGYPSDAAQQTVAPYFGGETAQANYAKNLAATLLGYGARKVFWYKLVDSGTGPLATYGLIKRDMTAKPALAAYGEAIKAYRP
jgi:GH35 family endo-1,4-beta-xylanase